MKAFFIEKIKIIMAKVRPQLHRICVLAVRVADSYLEPLRLLPYLQEQPAVAVLVVAPAVVAQQELVPEVNLTVRRQQYRTVSYTHLTLPTKRIV